MNGVNYLFLFIYTLGFLVQCLTDNLLDFYGTLLVTPSAILCHAVPTKQ